MWLARQVAAFLCVDTGSLRDLDHILKGMRYTVLLQLRHCKHRSCDDWTVSPPPPAQRSLRKVEIHLRDALRHFQA